MLIRLALIMVVIGGRGMMIVPGPVVHCTPCPFVHPPSFPNSTVAILAGAILILALSWDGEWSRTGQRATV